MDRGRVRTMTDRAQVVRLAAVLASSSLLSTSDGSTPEMIARAWDVPVPAAEAALHSLVAAGLARRHPGAQRDSYVWTALDDGPGTVGDVLAEEAPRMDDVDRIVGASTPRLPMGDRTLALAREYGPPPDHGTLGVFAAVFDAVPEYRDRLRAGGRLLDVGCGVGSHLISAALLFPRSSAVGVEVSGTVVDEARLRIARAGVEDRIVVRTEDARHFTSRRGFDVAFWAQPFFSREVRPAVLDSIHRALSDGGLLLMQELFSPPRRTHLRSMLDAARFESWDIPFARPAEDLAHEATSGGFSSAAVVDSPAGRLVLVRK